MKPVLDKEYQKFYLLHQIPFDAFRALDALANIQKLAGTATPVNMTVNYFRTLLTLGPHPDERGNALVLDADVVKETDAQLTMDELKAMRAELESNNEGKLKTGELQQQYAELYALTGG